uniref:C-type lectin domain-containing protein n=1 Tax=Oryzias latipes TaxID=8090 RepID=A0A3P9JQJ2_ORYLA
MLTILVISNNLLVNLEPNIFLTCTKTTEETHLYHLKEDSGCPDDWTRFGQQCFIFINSPKTWAEAESYCQFDGSNLASIHSYEENHFLQSLTRADTHNFPQAWIGGTDTMHFGLWTWSDGSRFLYENWSYKGKDGDADRCLKINYHSGFSSEWVFKLCCCVSHAFTLVNSEIS